MLHTPRARRAMITTPHHLAAQSGLAVMREDGNANEAMIAAAATIAVVYPHMNSIGGDGFWLIAESGKPPVGIDACGPAASLATPGFYESRGVTQAIPARGGGAALTVAGWALAHDLARHAGGRMPLLRLLEDAIGLARDGTVVTSTMSELTGAKCAELEDVHGFAEAFLEDGRTPEPGSALRQPRLAETLGRIEKPGRATSTQAISRTRWRAIWRRWAVRSGWTTWKATPRGRFRRSAWNWMSARSTTCRRRRRVWRRS